MIPLLLGWLLLSVGVAAATEKSTSRAARKAAYQAALESITTDDLSRHVMRLADDGLEGREAGTRGGRAAADYLAQEFARLKLRAAGTDGAYFQPFPPNYRNVLAAIEGSDPELKRQAVVVGAHYDHVGTGNSRNSRGPVGFIHNGADDNASGASAVLELAEAFTVLGESPRRSVLFAAFDAEEKGLFGAKHLAGHPPEKIERFAAVLNLDMLGRLRDERLTVFGTRTGYGWRRFVAERNERAGLLLDFSWNLTDQADHYPFFARGIPVLMFHTGLHDEYHTPRDKPKTLNNEGLGRVARLLFEVACELAEAPEVPKPRPAAARESEETRKAWARDVPELGDRLGVAWNDGPASSEGVQITKVFRGTPAEKAGFLAGDRVVLFAGRSIGGSDDLIGAVRGAESPATAVVRRPGSDEALELSVHLAGKPLRLGITWRVDEAEPGSAILTQVVPGSPAARAGLKPGDRVCRIAGRDFADEAEFGELARTLPGPIELKIERDGRLRTVVLHLAEPLRRAA